MKGCRLPSPPCFLENFLCVSAFCLDEGGCERLTILLTYMNFDLFPFIHVLVKDVFNIQHLTHLTLSLADMQEPYCHCHTKGKVKEGKTRKEGGARV